MGQAALCMGHSPDSRRSWPEELCKRETCRNGGSRKRDRHGSQGANYSASPRRFLVQGRESLAGTQTSETPGQVVGTDGGGFRSIIMIDRWRFICLNPSLKK